MHWLNKSGLVIRSLLCILRFGLYLFLPRFYGINLDFDLFGFSPVFYTLQAAVATAQFPESTGFTLA